MKKISIFLLILLSSYNVFSQGVSFQHSSLAEAFRMAKSQNKPLFVEVFSPTCHVCQSFIPVFDDAGVGRFINQNFVSYKIDINSSEFVEYFDKKRKLFVLSLPLMLFFDGNESFLHHAQLGMGQGAEVVLNNAQVALSPEKRSSNWRKAYQNGIRDKNFLINYALQCRLFRDTTANISAVNDLYKEVAKTDVNSNLGWLMCEQLTMDVDNGFFQFWINNVPTAMRFAKGREKQVLENIIFGSLYSSRGAKYSSDKINKINGYLAALSFSRNEITRKTMLPMTKALLHEGQTARAVGDVENYVKNASPTALEYAYFVSVFNDSAKDVSYKTVALNWLKKGVSITKSPSDLAEIHYQSARMYLKAKDKSEAMKAANLALRNAQAAKINLKKFQDLMN